MSATQAAVQRNWKVHAPDRYLSTRPAQGLVTVTFRGAVVASSRDAVWLHGGGREEVLYVPMADLKGVNVSCSDRTFQCRWKGAARYFDLGVGGQVLRNGAWAYPQAPDELADLRGRMAFDMMQFSVESCELRKPVVS